MNYIGLPFVLLEIPSPLSSPPENLGGIFSVSLVLGNKSWGGKCPASSFWLGTRVETLLKRGAQ